MGFLKFLRGKLSQMPEEIVDGQVYLAKNTKGLYVDVGTERLRLNPPADWNESNTGNPAFIANKPEIGTVASHDVAEELNQQNTIPTSKMVYNAIRDLRSEFANAVKVESPYVAHGITEMVDTSKPYVYVGQESGMNTGHWYWFDGENWQDGGVYNATAVDTDTTLLQGGKPADAAATGNQINELKGDTEDLYSKITALTNEVTDLSARADTFFDGLEVTTEGLVYGTQKDERLNGPYGPFAGNGGGGGGGGSYDTIDAVFSAERINTWSSNTVSKDGDVYFDFTWSSLENDEPNGNGTVTITINNVARNISVPQGENHLNLKQYCNTGDNQIRIRISDIYDQGKSWIVKVNVVELVIESPFTTSETYTGQITIPYTTSGDIQKTVYAILDKGTANETTYTNVTRKQSQLSFIIPEQGHGSHSLDLYYEADLNGQIVQSNNLHFEFISIRTGNNTPIIVSNFDDLEQDQYNNVVIPYQVYDPQRYTAEVYIYVNQELISEEPQNVDRGKYVNFQYRANTPGTIEIMFKCGEATKTITLNVTEQNIDIEAETEGLDLYLTTNGRSNSETNKNVWKYNNIQCEMTGFGWRSLDGWVNDDDGVTVLRTIGDARVYIPYKPFPYVDIANGERGISTTGETIEIEFATHNVIDYSTTIISCKANGIGFAITPQTVIFNSAQTELMTPFKEDEHIRVTIVIHSINNNRLLLFYINGIMSSAIQYPSTDEFSQGSDDDAVGISIGSNTCGVDIYNIRVYKTDLNKEQVINNWIADTQVGSLMIDRYKRNDIYDQGVIKSTTLPSNLPFFIINAVELPQYKDDKKTVTLTFTDPLYPSKSFSAEGVQMDVQGTSSQAYYRKNYDLQFKKGFNIGSTHSDSYSIDDAIPFNRFVIKADVASSESTNNTRLTMFYNEMCPYKTPEMLSNPKVRWGIEGRPCVVFWYDPDKNTTEFLGKYNFNLPKRCPGPLGYGGNDESWEVERNNSANVQFQDNDFETDIYDKNGNLTGKKEWQNDWEARFPTSDWIQIERLNEFVSWVKSTWRNDPDIGADFETPVKFEKVDTFSTISSYINTDDSFSYRQYNTTETNDGGEQVTKVYYEITFNKDTPAYRLTKFRVEAPKYMEIESASFYYLFTLFFLMIDSRAKNMFFGFHGSEATGLEHITRKVVFEPYDMDTAIGTNNSGVLKFGYYHLDTDTASNIISGSDENSGNTEALVFNAQNTVLWSNFRDAFVDKYSEMYSMLRSSGWNYENIERMYEEHQAYWPEALFNEDSYVKYLYPLVNAVTLGSDGKTPIKTDRYLTMLQGSKEQQRKWWLTNRFRYIDSMFNVGGAAGSMISMRLFHSGTLKVTPAIDLFVGVRFGLGSIVQQVRTTANTEISFPYVVKQGATLQEMESAIYSADLISDVGDLSVFYGNEYDFSAAIRLRKLKIGDGASNYSNSNLTTINVNNCFLLEEIDCRNCPNLAGSIDIGNSPMLEKAYFTGTSITGLNIVEGAPLTTLHLPDTIVDLVLIDHPNLTNFVVDGDDQLSHVTNLMLDNIKTTVVNPLTVVGQINSRAKVSIKDINWRIEPASGSITVDYPLRNAEGKYTGETEQRTLTTDAEKCGYQIESFFMLMRNMTGIESRYKNSNGDWIYVEVATPVITGTISATQLTGTQISEYKKMFPLLDITADSVESKRYYMSQDGKTLITGTGITNPVTVVDGKMASGQNPPSIVNANATNVYDYNSAKYTYTFAGWNTEKEKEVTNVDHNDYNKEFLSDHEFYAVFTKEINKYTVVWKNEDGTTLETDNDVPYGTTPTYNGSKPTKTVNGVKLEATTWTPAIAPVTGNVTYTAVYKPVYTATFVNDNGATLYSKSFIEDETPVYAGATNPPVNSTQENDGEFTFIGWSPALGPIKGNTTYTAQYTDNRSKTVQYLAGSLKQYTTTTTATPRAYAFYNMTSLESVETATKSVVRYTFQGCTNLRTVDLTSTSAVNIADYSFQNLSNLENLIVRSTSMSTLAYTSALNGTMIANYKGAVYVTSSIISSYTGNANWKNYLILPTTDYPVSSTKLFELYDAKFSTTTDSWDTISSNDNYATDYTVGTTKKAINGGEFGPILMQLVALDEDVKADGTGEARMTWISQDLIATHAMNPTNTTTRSGKYGNGATGWAGCELREWLIDDVSPQIDFDIGNDKTLLDIIVPVTKTQSIYSSSVQKNGQTTTDSIWIPSEYEIFGTETYESQGPVYTGWFNSSSTRIKKYDNSANFWWLRSAYSSAHFRVCSSGGSTNNNNANNANGVALGFCL